MASSMTLIQQTERIGSIGPTCHVYSGVDTCTEKHEMVLRAPQVERNGWAVAQWFQPNTVLGTRNNTWLQKLAIPFRMNLSQMIKQYMEIQDHLKLSRRRRSHLILPSLQHVQSGHASWSNSNVSSSLLDMSNDWEGYHEKKSGRFDTTIIQELSNKIRRQYSPDLSPFQDSVLQKFQSLPALCVRTIGHAVLTPDQGEPCDRSEREKTTDGVLSCLRDVVLEEYPYDVLAFTGSLFTDTIENADLDRFSDELSDVLYIEDRQMRDLHRNRLFYIVQSASDIVEGASPPLGTWTDSGSTASLTTATTVYSGSPSSCEDQLAIFRGGSGTDVEEWSALIDVIPATQEETSRVPPNASRLGSADFTMGDAKMRSPLCDTQRVQFRLYQTSEISSVSIKAVGFQIQRLPLQHLINDVGKDSSSTIRCSSLDTSILNPAYGPRFEARSTANGQKPALDHLCATRHGHGTLRQAQLKLQFMIEAASTTFTYIHLDMVTQIDQVCMYGYQNNDNGATVDFKPAEGGSAVPPKTRNRKQSKLPQEYKGSDEGSDDRSSPRSEKKSQTQKRRRLWACPYYKKDPRKYYGCTRYVLLGINRVKQHLRRSHVCAVPCYQRHSRAQPPESSHAEVHDEGLDQTQIARLSTRASRGQSEVRQWFQLWAIVFPHEPNPESPFLPAESIETQQSLSSLCQTGSDIIDDVLKDEGISPEITRRIIVRFHERVRTETFLPASPQQFLGHSNSITTAESVGSASGLSVSPATSTSVDDHYSTFSFNSSSTTRNAYILPTTLESESPDRTNSVDDSITTTRYLQEQSPWTTFSSTTDYHASRELPSIPSTTMFDYYLPNFPPIVDEQLDNMNSRNILADGSHDTIAHLLSSREHQLEGLDRGDVWDPEYVFQ